MNYDFGNKEYVEKVHLMLDDVKIPKVVKVRQFFPDKKVADVKAETRKQLEALAPDIKPGERIAITAGSRGIASYLELEQATVEYVKSRGAIPFIVPAMGSHGGATAEGQAALIRGYGITEEALGCEIVSSMEVVQIGETKKGLPIYIDKNAYEADGIILLNRIKSHTTFQGRYESGLVKMLAIGLAKHAGALITHRLTFDNMGESVETIGLYGLHNLKIKCGVASIENGYGEVSDVYALSAKQIEEQEPDLLKYSKSLMASFCVNEFDALIFKEMGKDISGAGMDTNAIGRYATKGKSGGPSIKKIGVLELTEKSHGNSVGMGYGDLITKEIADEIEFKDVYINCITTLNSMPAAMPMVLPNEETLIKFAVKAAGKLNSDDVSIIFATSTHEMDIVYMSEAAVKNIDQSKKYEIIGDYFDVKFDENGKVMVFNE